MGSSTPRTARRLVLSLGILVLLAAAAGVARAWAPDRSVEQLRARWAPPPSTFVPLLGMEVHVRDEGRRDDPAPILLLHGTSASLHTWDGWTSALTPARRVVRLDLPGFGLTGPFPDDDYTLAHYVRFLTAFLDRMGIARCVVAGNSFGGQLAWALAVEQPARVERVVLVDAAGFPNVPAAMPIGFRIARMPGFRVLGRWLLPRSVITSSLRNVYGDPAKVTDGLIDRYYEITLRAGNRAAVARRFEAIPSGTESDRIARVRQPTLILWGDRDHLIPVDHAARFQRAIPGSRVVRFPALGHVPQEEDPTATVAPVLAFLTE